LVGLIGDEGAEMLFKFSQIRSDVALVEMSVLIVLHVCRNTGAEASLAEGLCQVLNHVLNLKIL